MSKNEHIYVIISCAMSIDGYIDDKASEPLTLSNQQDFDEVDALRASCDAILVGATTIRSDNPRLVIKSEERRLAREVAGKPRDITKIAVTRSGELRADFRFFTTGECPKIVYCSNRTYERLSSRLNSAATVVSIGENDVEPTALIRDLANRGIRRILIEGGGTIHTMFLAADLVDEVRIAIAPFFVGEEAPRFVYPAKFPFDHIRRTKLVSCRAVGDMAVLTYLFNSPKSEGIMPSSDSVETDPIWLMRAIELSRQCIPSPNAYCVGAIIVGQDGTIISTGYSRETGPKMHAEEIAIARAMHLGAPLSDATIYTSLEPCSVRLSGNTSCTHLILSSGLKRVVYALAEPPIFVHCTGGADLTTNGIDVVCLPEFGWLVEYINAYVIYGQKSS